MCEYPLGQARLVRPGLDCTLVSYGSAMVTTLEAARVLSTEGLSAEVLDLRCLVPLDRARLLESVRKTGRLVVVHEANKFGGFGAEIAALVAEEAFEHLKSPIRRVAAPDIPVPIFTTPRKILPTKPGEGYRGRSFHYGGKVNRRVGTTKI